MNKKQLDSLSSSLSRAINPAARKIEATAKILEHIEPLHVVGRHNREEPSSPTHSAQPEEPAKTISQCHNPCLATDENPVEKTLVKMTTGDEEDDSRWPKSTVAKTPTEHNLTQADPVTTVVDLTTLDTLTGVRGELRIPNTILDSLLDSETRSTQGVEVSPPADS